MNLTVQNKTMLSTEIVKIINDTREEGAAVLAHSDFLKKAAKVLGSEVAGNFSAYYTAENGKKNPCLALPKREATLMVMSESYKVQAAVYDRMVELEQSVPEYIEKLKAEESLRIADFIAQSLRVSESSKLGMFQKVLSLKAPELLPLLPSYAVDAPIDYFTGSSKPTKSLTALLDDNGYKISAVAFNKIALADNFLEKLTRQSSKGMKEFLSITDKGLQYGKNITSPTSPRETQPHWYVDSFKEFAELVLKGE
jgi:hypothetical protein